MHQVDMPADERVVERRQAAEFERRRRIFDARNRVIGLDVNALNRQVAERRDREERERQREMACDSLSIFMDQKFTERQREEEERRRQLAKELVQHRAMYQRAGDSRDADINYKHKGGPDASLFKPEPLGPASMQVFQGQGDGEIERKKVQMEMNERMLRTQREIQEKCQKKQKEKDLLKGLELIQQDHRAVQLDALEDECKKAALIALKSYNQAQAEERQERERQDKQRHADMDLAEVRCMMTSDLLTECPDAGLKDDMGSRVIPDRWKGMSSEQLSAIRRQRAEQCAEKERQRQLDKQLNLAWDQQQLGQARQQVEDDRMVRELERERRVQMDQYNQQLAREQAAHQQYLDNKLYTNRPTRRYFSQFNASSR
ncbi:RIB43A-like with coiled-coils protein 1 [Bagarius yarrelli]|uniref:RIB43A-like with coiled-coils protein 1 n=1 Tax=Bagarius yarrelli TaxID=175774 RepID=A0A556UYU2_BAGYA|nr:RIB43A-like with coiled-coils protein 1 [Bagarius yarrelli]